MVELPLKWKNVKSQLANRKSLSFKGLRRTPCFLKHHKESKNQVFLSFFFLKFGSKGNTNFSFLASCYYSVSVTYCTIKIFFFTNNLSRPHKKIKGDVRQWCSGNDCVGEMDYNHIKLLGELPNGKGIRQIMGPTCSPSACLNREHHTMWYGEF